MARVPFFKRRFRSTDFHPAPERDVSDEIAFHLAQKVEDLIASGLSPEEAERRARELFGNQERVQDECTGYTRTRARRRTLGTLFEDVGQDLRFTLRTLRRRPLFTVIIVLTLGLGIGISTAMYSVIEGVLLYRLPFTEPDEIVNVFRAFPEWRDMEALQQYWDRIPIEYEQYRNWEERNTLFAGIGVHRIRRMILTGRGDTREIAVGVASTSLLPVLGVEPVLGRLFQPDEEGFADGTGAPVALVSHEMWRDAFGADPEVVGKSLQLNDRQFEVIGVLPRHFRLRWMGQSHAGEVDTGVRDIWIPLGSSGLSLTGGSWEAIGRLSTDIPREAAIAETGQILLGETDPGERYVRIVPRKEAETEGLTTPLVLLFAATALLMLIACINVATLYLSELYSRQKELITRAMLGAGRRRIVRQMLTESLALGLLGSLAGFIIAVAATRLFVALAPSIPQIGMVGLNARVLTYMVLAGLVTGLVFGTAPALLQAHTSSAAALRSYAHTATVRGRRFQQVVLLLQVAFTVVLLISGGLLTRSYSGLMSVDPGFNPRHLATLHITFPHDRDTASSEAWTLCQEIMHRTRSLPGVTAISTTNCIPFPGKQNLNTTPLYLSDPDTKSGYRSVRTTEYRIAPGYFGTLELPLLAGRAIAEQDGPEASPVCVINESLARRNWGDTSPVGDQVAYWGGRMTIVGVIGDARREALDEAIEPTMYVPLAQRLEELEENSDVYLMVRTAGDTRAVIPAVRESIRSIDDDILVEAATPMTAYIADSTREERFRTFLMGSFALMALLLALAGIFGVTARAVASRSTELGIRLALGARHQSLIGSSVRQNLKLFLLGLGCGLGLSLWTTRFLSGFLFEITVLDPATWVIVALLFLLVCLLASYLPARRVLRIDPVAALRAE